MKKFLKTLLGSLILGIVVIGILGVIGFIADWLMEDTGRYILGIGILGYVVYRCFMSEFGE